jgi:prepilin-type N-terminal cleavage/methylation domain-containing protein
MKLAAFTLVELLVVIAIMGLLAGLLYPVFGEAKSRSQSAECLSHLKQLHQAYELYSTDNFAPPFAHSFAHHHLILQGSWPYPVTETVEISSARPVHEVLSSFTAGSHLHRCPLDRMDAILAAEGGHRATWFEEVGSSYDFDDFAALGIANPPDGDLGSILFVDRHTGHSPSTAVSQLTYHAVRRDGSAKKISNAVRLSAFLPLAYYRQ